MGNSPLKIANKVCHCCLEIAFKCSDSKSRYCFKRRLKISNASSVFSLTLFLVARIVVRAFVKSVVSTKPLRVVSI